MKEKKSSLAIQAADVLIPGQAPLNGIPGRQQLDGPAAKARAAVQGKSVVLKKKVVSDSDAQEHELDQEAEQAGQFSGEADFSEHVHSADSGAHGGADRMVGLDGMQLAQAHASTNSTGLVQSGAATSANASAPVGAATTDLFALGAFTLWTDEVLTRTSPSPDVQPTVISGTFAAGPAVSGHNLMVKLYDAKGNQLKTADGKPEEMMLDTDGKFSINVGSHTGRVLLQLVDKDSAPDYRDEATGLALDLTGDLLAVGTASTGANTININPLSTLAAKMAGIAVSASGLDVSNYIDAKAATANTDVAKAFGLSGDVTQLDTTTVIKADGSPNPGASDLGKVLAALSGLDLTKGSQQAAIDSFLNNGALVPAATLKEKLLEGALVAQVKLGANTDLVKAVSSLLSAGASTAGYSIDPIASDDVIDAADTLTAGVTSIAFQVPAGKTAADLEVWMPGASVKSAASNLTLANGVATYKLDAADITALTSGDGVKAVQIKATGGATVLAERLVMVNRIDDAPTKVSLVNVVSSLDELAGSATTGARVKVADIVVTDADGGANTLALTGADAGRFEIDGNALYIKAGQALNFEAKSSYAVAVTATGGATPATVTGAAQTINLKDINEAPTASGTISPQTAVKGQSAWSLNLASYFADIDVGDALTYSIASGTFPAGLSLSNGVIGGTPIADTSQAGFIVTATDKGGLSTTQTFQLRVVAAPVVQSFTVADTNAPTANGKGGDSVTFEITLSEAITFTSPFGATFSMGGQTVTATGVEQTGGANGLNKLTFTATLPNTGDGAFTLTGLSGGGTTLGKVSGEPLEAYSGNLSFSGYIVDNSLPTVSTTTFDVNENTTAVGTLAANETVTWALGTGGDAALFNLSNGALSFKITKNFEVDAKTYTVNVVATDEVGNVRNQALTINLKDINKVPTLANPIADQTFVVSGALDTFAFAANTFADVDANTNLVYTATLANGTALPTWLTFNAATRTFSGNPTAAGQIAIKVTASDGSLTVADEFNIQSVTAPNLSTTLTSSTVLDVRSKIVLTVGEDVTANAGGKITLSDKAGGFRGDVAGNHTQEIDVTDASQVSVVNNNNGTWSIIVNPKFDLDLSSDYELSVSTGAFKGKTTNQDSVAFSTVAFKTVAPGAGLAGAQEAVLMKNDGTLDTTTKYKWFDASSIGDPTGMTPPTEIDVGAGNFVATFKSIDHTSGTLDGDGALKLLNFGAHDLVYIDEQDHSRVDPNALWSVNFFAQGTGSQALPLETGLAGNGTIGANTLIMQVDPSITLPDLNGDYSYANVTRPTLSSRVDIRFSPRFDSALT